MGRARGAALALALVIVVLGWTALAYEFDLSLTRSFAKGRGWCEALFLFFRFFTIQTNIAVAILMTMTALRLARNRPLLPPLCYTGALVYIVVTCVTYELMLRREWIPHGIQYVSDMTMHDVVPALTLGFWLLWLKGSTRHHATWRDPAWMLVYPAAYFVLTLVAGVLGEGYPYSFLNVAKRGYLAVCLTAALFLGIFFVLGLILTALVRARQNRGGDPSRAV